LLAGLRAGLLAEPLAGFRTGLLAGLLAVPAFAALAGATGPGTAPSSLLSAGGTASDTATGTASDPAGERTAAEESGAPVPFPGAAACAHARALAAAARADDRLEPTANQRAWDALEYALDVRLEPDSARISGWADVRLRVLAPAPEALERIELDFCDSLEAHFVVVNGTWLDPDSVRHEHDLLIIPLPAPLAAGEEARIRVSYEGKPRQQTFDGLKFGRVTDRPIVWSFGGPRGARRWWPCKDHPEDKADRVYIRADVPAGLELVANGAAVARTPQGDRTVFEWLETAPIATYLVAIAAYPYSIYEDSYVPAGPRPEGEPEAMPILFYNYPESRAAWEPVQAKVKDMIAGFAEPFGEYPFLHEKYGHAQVPFAGGMEHQTITSLGNSGELVVAHELAHQWWGDEITCADFHDVWLNEGFATYAEALWLEQTQGIERYHAHMENAQFFGAGTIYVPEVSDPDRVYHPRLSYAKGAWVLHMLRHVVGDEDFFEILRAFRARQRDLFGGVARTEDLATVASEVAGRDLHPFFRRWIGGAGADSVNQGYPIYRYDWSASPAGPAWEVSLRVRQMQAGPLFPMPIDVEIWTGADLRDTTLVVENAAADTTYTLTVLDEPRTVLLDPDQWILRRVLEPMPKLEPRRQILLVNGVGWRGENGAAARDRYAAQAFTGGLEYDFWDYQPEPDAGYPAGMPRPRGHGEVPGQVLGEYRAVIWVGNLLDGDDQGFRDSPLHAYLEAGGNLLLMTLGGRSFLLEPFREYLGIDWAAGDSTATAYEALEEGLPDLRTTGVQSFVSYFRAEPGAGRRVLYAQAGDPERALGVVRLPEADGSSTPGTGRFVFLSGRAYRWDPKDLRAAMSVLIPRYLVPVPDVAAGLRLRAPVPNPTRDGSGSRIGFLLPTAARARLAIYDVTGREIRVLRDAPSAAGWNAEVWDGRDAQGNRAPAGLYFARVTAAGEESSGRIVRIR